MLRLRLMPGRRRKRENYAGVYLPHTRFATIDTFCSYIELN
ncbi:MAG TPA: hypothetical protein VFG05_04820 [Methylocella sp.]|nr:hypothetical protein [Methylocella sp.]